MRASAGDDTTMVGGGTYTLSAPLAMTAQDAGSHFLGTPGETETVSGGGKSFSLFTVTGATNIGISGLTLTGVTTTASDPSNVPAGISVLQSSGLTFDGDTFLNLPKGVFEDDGVHHVMVSNSSFTNMGSSAVDMTPTTHENTVINNVMSHIGFQFPNAGGGSGAVNMSESWGDLVSHNRIPDTADRGVNEINYDPNIKSGGNTVEYNIISQTGRSVNDTGAIYAFSMYRRRRARLHHPLQLDYRHRRHQV